MKKIIEEDLGKISTKNLKKKLNKVSKEYDETLKVHNSSSKLLTFLVNDILDFAQLRSTSIRQVQKRHKLFQSERSYLRNLYDPKRKGGIHGD